MASEITIDPVTRIEGHARIRISLDDAGQVADAHFQVTQFRGFEKICQGRPLAEMPSLMARICGICPSVTSSRPRKPATAFLRSGRLRSVRTCVR